MLKFYGSYYKKVVNLQLKIFMMQTDSNSLLKKCDKLVRTCIKDYGLINNGDKVLIGLSGGKDSLALTQLLAMRSKIHAPKFSVTALHIRNEGMGYASDTEYLKEFCEKLGVEFEVIDISIDLTKDKRKSPCFLCSWYRRKALFEYAKKNGFKRIALGHHKDDIIATLIMNMAFQGSFSSMPPLMQMNKFDVAIIRPLALIEERDIKELAINEKYIIQKKSCPYEKSSFRSDAEKVIADLEKLNPNVKSSIWKSMENIMPDYLPKKSC